MRRLSIFSIVFVIATIVMSVTACDEDDDKQAVLPETETSDEGADESAEEKDDESTEDQMEEYMMNILVNGHTLSAKMVANSSTKALRDILKSGSLTLEMNDYSNFEKVGELGYTLPTNNTQITTSAGDLILYLGSRFVIYYDTNSWNFTRLGKIENISQSELKNILGTGDVTAVLSLAE